MQQETFVCQHIVDGLVHKRRVGFFWTPCNAGNPRPDAWCSACNERNSSAGGEWAGKALEHLQPKVLCGACYDVAKQFHMGGDPWS
jgi:hypothetical protein